MSVEYLGPPPELPGVEHRYVRTSSGLRIHVAEAGPSEGSPVMLVHGFPQHWWEWHRLIGPLAADGYRVLVPDLRGAGWSDAPRGRYSKAGMADDLVAVLDQRGVDRVWIAAHDWGGPAGFILLLRHPDRVAGFAGFNTVAPWLRFDGPNLRHAWAFYYQYPLLSPGIGPRLIGSSKQRYVRWLARWVGGGYEWPERDSQIYLSRMRDPARAYAGSQWYRTFQSGEFLSWIRGEYADAHVEVPLRWVTGLKDPVITPTMHRGYEDYASDITFEHVPDVGHWIIEQAHDLVLDRLRSFLNH
jgi:pimeloyl-ACP methyl ester carboxylesterase